MIDSNGDGSVYVKGSGGTIQIGAGNATIVTVGRSSTTVVNDLVVTGDLGASGGYVRSYSVYGFRVLQGAFSLMTSSMIHSSALLAGTGMKYLTRIPLRSSGSIIGISIVAEDGIVKSGSLTASININDIPVASLGMFTGTMASTTFAKDLYAFNGNSYLTVALTASTGYLNSLEITSCSFTCIVDVEM